ncbi:glycosyltransferase [uncultured Ornithinimicrobium sp.]|uniref:glycosyltransferase n=1 Tax=uncultured Ornithinimicrobium sp. TaxID=259307 RepID=UPI002594A6DC|nr:glycosyltransferase [uncultured Ornithinimicrobium sp.]
MRVLVVTTWFPTPSSPGTGVFVARDVSALADRHDVRVLHLVAHRLAPAAGADTGEVPGVPVRRLVMDPRRPDHVLRAARVLRREARSADLVHTMAVSALLPTVRWRPAVPWVHTEHWSGLGAPGTLSPGLRLARRVVRHLLAGPDVVAVVGEELAAEVRRHRAGPVAVVPNIVTRPPALAPRRRPQEPLAARGPFELVGVGGLIGRKDPLTAVQTAAELRRRGVDARLTWVGEGPLHDRVEAAARGMGVPARLTGPLPPEQVQELVAEADLFLLPSRAETFCVAAAEALAAGRPVVVGDSGGPRAFVRPPAGALVRPGAPPAVWADAVERVWRASATTSAEEIADPVAGRYGPDRYADRVDEVYATARGGGRPAGDHGPAPEDHPVPEDDGPLVDLVVATHSPDRRTGRAVASALTDDVGGGGVRVSVVCHNVDPGVIRATLPQEVRDDPRVRLLELHDGVASPSGPFNAGLDAATAPWAAIMGSDDTLAPGALSGWLAAAEDLDPDDPVVVVPPLELAGRTVPTPPVRPGRRDHLDLVRDRLSYRSAPLGLLSRGALRLPGARLLEGAQVGGDVPMVTALWSRARVVLARDAPPYRIHEDATDRVTYDPRPLQEQLRSVDALWDLPATQALPRAARQALGTKVLRIHVFGSVPTRPDPAWWTPAERAELARVTRRVLAAAPGCADPLSLADADLLGAVLDPGVPADRLLALAAARRRHGRPRTLLPSSWRHVLHREAPLRLMAASLAARRS